jgi:hypothetical protein
MRKAVLTLFGLLALLIGLLTVWTPLPTGVPLIALSIVILVGVSPTARRLVRFGRDRFDWFHYGLAFVENRTARNMATPLKRTRPLRRRLVPAAGAAVARVRRGARPPVCSDSGN